MAGSDDVDRIRPALPISEPDDCWWCGKPIPDNRPSGSDRCPSCGSPPVADVIEGQPEARSAFQAAMRKTSQERPPPAESDPDLCWWCGKPLPDNRPSGSDCPSCGRNPPSETVEDGCKAIRQRIEKILPAADPIDPPHYRQGTLEVIDAIEGLALGYREGNCLKYLARYKYKNGLEDLRKARWYLERLIREVE